MHACAGRRLRSKNLYLSVTVELQNFELHRLYHSTRRVLPAEREEGSLQIQLFKPQGEGAAGGGVWPDNEKAQPPETPYPPPSSCISTLGTSGKEVSADSLNAVFLSCTPDAFVDRILPGSRRTLGTQ